MIFEYSKKNLSAPVAYSSLEVMHTMAEIILPYKTESESKELIEALWHEFERIDRLFNRHSQSSPVWTINQTAATQPVEVEEELFLAMEMCSVFYRSTDGCFDITANIGSRTSLKGDKNYILDTSAKTVRFIGDGIKMDFGGFAKGYALEKAAKMLKEASVTCALLNLGSSSILAIGTHPFGDYWPVTAQHPYFGNRASHTFELRDKSISFSGCDRHGNAHIIDPSSGNTLSRKEMIAVIGPSALVCEVLSTALYVADPTYRAPILKRFEGYTACEIHYQTDGKSVIKEIRYD